MWHRAVLTGCSKKYEENLRWWIKRFRSKTKLPLIFADFGLSFEGRALAEELADEVLDCNKSSSFSWGLKQKAFAACDKFAVQLLWVDMDCEIFDDLQAIFELSEDANDFYIGRDVPKFIYPGDTVPSVNQFQAGMFLTRPGHSIIAHWLDLLETIPNDQKAISLLIENCPSLAKFVKVIPIEMHCPRLLFCEYMDKANHLPLVVHWTGQVGDEILRTRIRFEEMRGIS